MRYDLVRTFVMPKTKLLFVCTGNRDRSPTAEDLFHDSEHYEAKSAGTSAFAVQKVTQELIDWADKIFVMCELEDRHLTYLESRFNTKCKPIIDLDIPDRYERGSQELINLLASRLSKHLPPKPKSPLNRSASDPSPPSRSSPEQRRQSLPQ